MKFRLQSKEEARKEVQKWAELQPMTMEYLGQKLDLIDTEKYLFELPTKALLLLLIIVTDYCHRFGYSFSKMVEGA